MLPQVALDAGAGAHVPLLPRLGRQAALVSAPGSRRGCGSSPETHTWASLAALRAVGASTLYVGLRLLQRKLKSTCHAQLFGEETPGVPLGRPLRPYLDAPIRLSGTFSSPSALAGGRETP